MGEKREGYTAREMTKHHRSTETVGTFLRITEEAADLSGGLLTAADQEIAGISRLHDLVPAFSTINELTGYDAAY